MPDIWEVSFGFHDGENHTSVFKVNLDGTLAVATLDTWSPLFHAILENITHGDVREVRISKLLDVFTAGSATADSDVELKALFSWQPLGTIKKMISRIPAFRREYILDNSDQIDTAQANVAAFTDAMLSGIDAGGTQVRPLDTEGRTLDGLLYATEDYGRKRK